MSKKSTYSTKIFRPKNICGKYSVEYDLSKEHSEVYYYTMNTLQFNQEMYIDKDGSMSFVQFYEKDDIVYAFTRSKKGKGDIDVYTMKGDCAGVIELNKNYVYHDFLRYDNDHLVLFCHKKKLETSAGKVEDEKEQNNGKKFDYFVIINLKDFFLNYGLIDKLDKTLCVSDFYVLGIDHLSLLVEKSDEELKLMMETHGTKTKIAIDPGSPEEIKNVQNVFNMFINICSHQLIEYKKSLIKYIDIMKNDIKQKDMLDAFEEIKDDSDEENSWNKFIIKNIDNIVLCDKPVIVPEIVKIIPDENVKSLTSYLKKNILIISTNVIMNLKKF